MDSMPQGLKSEHQEKVQELTASRDDWLALRDRGGYTIQLIGVSNKEAIATFTNKHGLQGEMAYITTEHEGRVWYILLYGAYANYTEAVNALQALPEVLKSQQP
jgi:DamX protein